MSVRSTTARLSLTTALIAGLAFAGAAAPAAAADEDFGLYSATNDENGGTFLSLSTTDAAATAIGGEQAGFWITSVEYADGVAYALGATTDALVVATWNISTGALVSVVPLALPAEAGILADVDALDIDAEGRLLAYASINDGEGTPQWIVAINPTSGAVTPLLELPQDDGPELYYEGIGTNPTDGVTYLFLDYNDGMPQFAPVDFATSTVGALTPLEGIQDSLGTGYILEGDFDSTGELWFTYSTAGVSRSNGELDVAAGATELGDPEITSKAIAIGPVYTPPAPQLAATGLEVAPVAAGAALLLALGGALMIARRRAHA